MKELSSKNKGNIANFKTYSKGNALKEYLQEGKYISNVEAILLLGIQNLYAEIKILRTQGWIIKSRKIALIKVLTRLNKMIVVKPNPNLPVNEILTTEYWLSVWILIRPWQQEAHDKSLKWWANEENNKNFVTRCSGSGKTLCASFIAKSQLI